MENEGSSSVVAPKAPEGIIGWIESVIITAAQTSVGQSLFKLIDSFLWVVEKSAQWSLPSQEINAEENGKVFGKVELVRPLPWVLFLPGLVILRVIRSGLNVGAFILGYPRIQPSGMVKFVQRSRRRLRTMNLKAIKSARRRTSNNKDKRLTMIEAKKALIRSIKLTLSTLSCMDTSKSSPSPPPTKIRISGMDLETAVTPDEKSTTESAGSPMQMEVKRKFSQVSSADESSDDSDSETLQSKIDRLAQQYDSSDDPDFNPAECSMQSSTSSEDEAELNMSPSELKEVQSEANQFFDEMKEKPTIFPVDQKTSWKELGKIAASIERVDSPGESVYSSAKEYEDDDDVPLSSPISWTSCTPETSTSSARSFRCTALSADEVQTVSKQTSDFINGEVDSTASSTPAEPVSPTQEVTNGVVAEKRKTETSGTKPRASVPKENPPAIQEKKSSPRKKAGRKDAK